jgi:hypothetical protein
MRAGSQDFRWRSPGTSSYSFPFTLTGTTRDGEGPPPAHVPPGPR